MHLQHKKSHPGPTDQLSHRTFPVTTGFNCGEGRVNEKIKCVWLTVFGFAFVKVGQTDTSIKTGGPLVIHTTSLEMRVFYKFTYNVNWGTSKCWKAGIHIQTYNWSFLDLGATHLCHIWQNKTISWSGISLCCGFPSSVREQDLRDWKSAFANLIATEAKASQMITFEGMYVSSGSFVCCGSG